MLRESRTGRFRAGLRAVIPAAITGLFVLIAALAVPIAVGSLVGGDTVVFSLLIVLGQWVVYLVAIALGLWLAIRLDRGSLARFGLDVDRTWLTNFGAGFVISLVVSAVYFGYGAWRGYFTVYPERITELGDLPLGLALAVLGGVVVAILLANVWEEVVFRGVMLQNFAEGLSIRGFSPVWAVGVATTAHALLFGIYHIPEFFVVAWYTSFIGIIFAVAYLVTGRLGLAIGVHFGRFPIEFFQGEDLGAVELPTVVEVGVLPLAGSIEILVVEVSVSCSLVLVWAFVIRGEIGIADRIYEPEPGGG